MLYSCTHMATVGVKGLKLSVFHVVNFTVVINRVLCTYRRSSLLTEFINSVPRNQLLQHKMVLINDIVHSPIFLRLGQQLSTILAV